MSIKLLMLLSELNTFLWRIAVDYPEHEETVTSLMRKLRRCVDEENEATLEQTKKITKQYGNERNN
jgi:hypothetical protein